MLAQVEAQEGQGAVLEVLLALRCGPALCQAAGADGLELMQVGMQEGLPSAHCDSALCQDA